MLFITGYTPTQNKKLKKKGYGVQIEQNQKAVICNRILFC